MGSVLMVRNELQRTTPEQEGISSANIEKFIECLEESGTEMHGLMIIRHGKVITEGWWSPYAAGIVHGLQSLSKTYAATAVGLAYDDGLVRLEDRLVDLFPGYLPENQSENLKKITVRDVLRMGSGMVEMPEMGDPDWIRRFFGTPVVHEPGTAFFYNSIGSSMLCAIVRKVTHRSVMDYLKERLFNVIGIDADRVKWMKHPDGTENGGAGFFATTEDNARLALLYLNKGLWEGKRVLSEKWIEEATANQMHSYEDPGIADCKLGYGFQMWMCAPGQGVYRFDGAYGQYAIVFPKLDLVVSINETASLGAGAQKTLDIVWNVLLPAVGQRLPENAAAAAHLKKRLECLSLPKPLCRPYSPVRDQVNRAVYTLDHVNATILPKMYLMTTGQKIPEAKQFSLEFIGSVCSVTWNEGNDEFRILLGLDGQPRLNENVVDHIITGKILGSGFWLEDNLFVMQLRYVETCFKKEIRFRFGKNGVNIEISEVVKAVSDVNGPLKTCIIGKKLS